MAIQLGEAGRSVVTGAKVVSLHRDGIRLRAATVEEPRGGRRHEVEGRYFLTSATLSDTIAMIDPPPPPEVMRGMPWIALP